LVATPIGNLADLSPRAGQALAEAGCWIVEDTRVSGRLSALLDVRKPMRVLNDHTTDAQLERLADLLRDGADVALITDGGSPAISDPGARLTDRCYALGIPVEGVPGPSAPILALMLSGFFAQRFAFLGFLGRKAGAIRGELEPFADSPLTLVMFESPHRLDALFAAAHDALGPRRYAICRELTKLHEQVFRGTMPEVPEESAVPRRGEITLVIEGRRKRSEP
jgi:16S rRNA (cytidine1402-2'-O)-methyltransferase